MSIEILKTKLKDQLTNQLHAAEYALYFWQEAWVQLCSGGFSGRSTTSSSRRRFIGASAAAAAGAIAAACGAKTTSETPAAKQPDNNHAEPTQIAGVVPTEARQPTAAPAPTSEYKIGAGGAETEAQKKLIETVAVQQQNQLEAWMNQYWIHFENRPFAPESSELQWKYVFDNPANPTQVGVLIEAGGEYQGKTFYMPLGDGRYMTTPPALPEDKTSIPVGFGPLEISAGDQGLLLAFENNNWVRKNLSGEVVQRIDLETKQWVEVGPPAIPEWAAPYTEGLVTQKITTEDGQSFVVAEVGDQQIRFMELVDGEWSPYYDPEAPLGIGEVDNVFFIRADGNKYNADDLQRFHEYSKSRLSAFNSLSAHDISADIVEFDAQYPHYSPYKDGKSILSFGMDLLGNKKPGDQVAAIVTGARTLVDGHDLRLVSIYSGSQKGRVVLAVVDKNFQDKPNWQSGYKELLEFQADPTEQIIRLYISIGSSQINEQYPFNESDLRSNYEFLAAWVKIYQSKTEPGLYTLSQDINKPDGLFNGFPYFCYGVDAHKVK